MAKARLTKNYAEELEALKRKQAETRKRLQERGKKIKAAQKAQGGSLVDRTGLGALPPEIQAGAMLEAVEKAKDPRTSDRWHKRGAEFLRREREQVEAAPAPAPVEQPARSDGAPQPDSEQQAAA
jgi:hypothetical protein